MKKFMKKVVAVCLAVVCTVSLTACEKKAEGEVTAQNRLEKIQEQGYIEVVMEPYFAPYQFIDPTKPQSEQVVGADVELAKYIAEQLGVECRIIPLEFSAVLAGVAEGKYDMAISALAYTPARAEAMALSNGYYFSENNAGHGLVVREELVGIVNGAEDVEGLVVVAQSGSLQELFVTEQLEGYSEFKRVLSTNDMLLSVQEGKADVGVTNIATAQLYINANPGCGLCVVEGFTFEESEETMGARIGMPLGEDELVARVNEIIAEVVASGKYEEWYAEYAEYAKTLGIE